MEALCWFLYNGIIFHWQLLNFQHEIAKGMYSLTLQIADPPTIDHFSSSAFFFFFFNESRFTNFRHHSTYGLKFSSIRIAGKISFHYEIKSTFFHIEIRLASDLWANI